MSWTSNKGGSALTLVLVLSCALPGAGQPHPQSNELLILEKTQGKAPLSVTLTGPSELVADLIAWQKAKRGRSMWGEGFWINWGDGTGDGDSSPPREPPSATQEIGKHTFTKPGTYSVEAGIYKFMPDDSHQVYWRGQVNVTVQEK